MRRNEKNGAKEVFRGGDRRSIFSFLVLVEPIAQIGFRRNRCVFFGTPTQMQHMLSFPQLTRCRLNMVHNASLESKKMIVYWGTSSEKKKKKKDNADFRFRLSEIPMKKKSKKTIRSLFFFRLTCAFVAAQSRTSAARSVGIDVFERLGMANGISLE